MLLSTTVYVSERCPGRAVSKQQHRESERERARERERERERELLSTTVYVTER